MKTNNRRDFLKKSIMGLSGTALLASGTSLDASGKAIDNTPAALPTRPLGKTGVHTPLISMGTSGVTSPGLVKAAYEAGVKLFFSANYYGRGNNEILVGEGLKGLPRESFLVGTAAIPNEMNKGAGTLNSDFTAEKYMKSAEASLKRFGLETIDFVLLPFASKKETILNEDVLKTFEQLKKQGEVKYVGIASHSGTVEALNAAAESGVYDVAMIGYNYKTQNLEELNTAIHRAAKAGMGIVAMKTTAGAARSKTGPSINTDAALKWVLQNENISSIVSGMTSVELVQKNLKMIQNLKMSEQEMKELGMTSGYDAQGLYCQQCQQCVPQCPHHLDIPTIMRSYMYAYGYKNLEQAWHTLAEVDLSNNPCHLCDVCNVNCASRFDVRNKVMDIARLKDVPIDLLSV